MTEYVTKNCERCDTEIKTAIYDKYNVLCRACKKQDDKKFNRIYFLVALFISSVIGMTFQFSSEIDRFLNILFHSFMALPVFVITFLIVFTFMMGIWLIAFIRVRNDES